MMSNDREDQFIEPWADINEYPDPEASKKALLEEALREIPSGHPLYSKSLNALARREDCDDVLFHIADSNQVTVVHLTWSGKAEKDGYPLTEVFENLAVFRSTRMRRDAEEWE